jgi:hypothetical protein
MLAKSYYKQAEVNALKANELAADAREVREALHKEREILDRWADIMSHNPITIFTIIFVLVSVGEYLISLELYTDLLPRAPFIIPLVIIGISIVISHWLAYKFVPGLRLMEYDEKRRSPLHQSKTDEHIQAEVDRKSNITFYLGLLAAIGITIFIFFMSKERVDREIAAGMREKGFGFYDALPVLFYIAEIITGVYVIYLLKRLRRILKASSLQGKLENLMRSVAQHTENTISNFERAEAEGFNILEKTISESIHIAYFRNKNCNPSDEENYIAEPQNLPLAVKFRITRADKAKALNATVHIHTEYNYAATAASDDSGLVEHNLSSFAGDTVKKLIVEFSDGANCEDTGVYQTGNTNPHTVLFRE